MEKHTAMFIRFFFPKKEMYQPVVKGRHNCNFQYAGLKWRSDKLPYVPANAFFSSVCAQCECCPYLGVAPIDRLTPLTATHPEELLGGAGVQSAVGDVGLLGQVLRALDGGNHPLHGEEGGQVGRVGRDDDEGEEPPDASHYPSRQGLGHEL